MVLYMEKQFPEHSDSYNDRLVFSVCVVRKTVAKLLYQLFYILQELY